jgi:hypothetical protein
MITIPLKQNWSQVYEQYRQPFSYEQPCHGHAWAHHENDEGLVAFVRYSFDPDGNVETLLTHLWQSDTPDVPEGLSPRARAQAVFEFHRDNPTASFVGERTPDRVDRHTAWLHARTKCGWIKSPNRTELRLPITHGIYLEPGQYHDEETES